MKRLSAGSLLFFAAAALAPAAAVRAEPALVPARHVWEVVQSGSAQVVGKLPAGQIMDLDLVLPLRDAAGLDDFLSEVYDPASASYLRFLSVQDFTARFGPSQADFDAVVNFARVHGFTVTGGSRDSMEVQVSAPVSAVEAAFHVRLQTFRHPFEDRAFFAPDRSPTVNLPVKLANVSGLDNYSIPRPLFVAKSDYAAAHGIDSASLAVRGTGSGPQGSFLGSDMRAAYYGGAALTGAGQHLGLFEFLGTNLADFHKYLKNAGEISTVPITILSTDKSKTTCYKSAGCDDTEQTLDLTQVVGMAPGLASVVMYVGRTDTAILGAMTTHRPLARTISCSWVWWGDPDALDPYFKRMAAQGQSFFAASGDSGTWSLSYVPWPADGA